MKYFLIAGEASGDLHASRLMKHLILRDPNAEFRFFGGDKMSRYGGSPLIHYRNMAFMGFVNVIRNLDKIISLHRLAQREVILFHPDHVILVDYPGFNLSFAKFVKANLPNTIVDYYIAPKLWAWKSWRIHTISRYIDNMYTIFPFETEWFKNRGYDVHYVGNPSVDAIDSFRRRGFNRNLFLSEHGIAERPLVLLLAGSRMQEIRDCLPIMASVAKRFPNYQFIVAAAPGINIDIYHQLLKGTDLLVLQNVTYELMSVASAAIVNSGTATLEAALFRLPQVVVYKVFGGRLAMMLKPLVIHTRFVSLVNIIAGHEIVRELLGHHFTVDSASAELSRLLSDETYRTSILAGYDYIINLLGKPGAPLRIASSICK
ncbi:MAG: lipid-A-disaccharide synthase [Paludibacteraceae bacterium]|nr:lipid-A-disaccharide synthase [Paludibacteraceae bacterium]